MNFQGVYNNSIDPKGRASIPAQFREKLSASFAADNLVVTQKDGGLAAYPESEWEKNQAKVEAMEPGPLKEALYLALISPAKPCSFDKQGRIQLSQAHRDYAGLDSEIREIVVVGVDRRIMIWSKAKHAEMQAQAETRIVDDPQVLANLGF